MALVQRIRTGVKTIMATMQEVIDDLNGFAQEVTDYVAARDAADATLKQQLADALANGGVATQAQVDAAFAAAEAVKGSLTVPTPPAPPTVNPAQPA